MAVEKMLTLQEFQSNPELKAKFGGDYTKYLDSFSVKLNAMGLFGFAAQNSKSNIPGLNNVSLFFGAPASITEKYNQQVQEQQDKKQEAIEEKLNKIKDPKLRAQVEAELSSTDLSDALFDLMIARYEKKHAEFEEIWAKYQIAKAEAADMKKVCEKILREYQNNQNVSVRSKYIEAEHSYNEANMWAEIYLSESMDAAY